MRGSEKRLFAPRAIFRKRAVEVYGVVGLLCSEASRHHNRARVARSLDPSLTHIHRRALRNPHVPSSCQMQVESQRAEPLPAAVAERASILMRHINTAAGEGELYNNEFLSSLARLRFVPVHLPPPAHRPDDDDDAVFATEVTGGSGGGGGRGGDEAWSGGVVLLRFEEAAVPKNRNLVFTAFPVHMTGLVPPQVGGNRVVGMVLGGWGKWRYIRGHAPSCRIGPASFLGSLKGSVALDAWLNRLLRAREPLA